ncbi:Wzz/FepE/Etk N-terminal domain-containing protein [Thioalkalivibrio sp. ALE12]|uniref:Wzz/FepE/Etk N-terminal domain-containing protein n=1 Tax=Thioalkalivibrio sp. ALE12 TaxID=1158170 RepID=UPI00037CF7F8|nr:Wzz/FepE/Etk N-terminal domain-containing protein [Thioalkalivibrio sp. ALE12]
MSTKDTPTPPQPIGRGPYDDEISLVDLWKVLARRKWWILSVTVAVFFLGTAYGVFHTPSYSYQTTIQLGQDSQGNRIDDPEVTVSFLNDVLIPGIWRDLLADADDVKLPEARARHTEGTEYVHLTTSAPLHRQESVEQLHSLTVRALRREHNLLIDDVRARLDDQRRTTELEHQAQLADLQNELEIIEERKVRATAQFELLEEERFLLEEQIEDLHPLRHQLDSAISDTDQQSAPLWTMMPMASITEMRFSAERRLRTQIPDQINEVQQRLTELENAAQRIQSEIEREQARHDMRVAALKRDEERIRETTARGSAYALASDTPDGPGRSLFAALSLVLGLLLGIFGAFFREFLANARAAEDA